jgi:uncharacterized coiled-coil protein SlyX
MPDEETDLKEGQETEVSEDAFTDDVLIEGFDEDTGGDKKTDGDEKDDKTEKKDGKTADTRLAELESTVAKLKEDKQNLNKALHEERQSKKKGADTEEVKLDDAALTKLLEEYKDDPQTLKNIMRYIAREEARGAKKEAMDETQLMSRKKDVDSFLKGDLPDVFNEDSELHGVIVKIKDQFGLKDHPFGDLFAVGVHMAVNRKVLLRNAFDAGVKAKTGQTVEATRKETIKGNALLKGSGTSNAEKGLTAGHLDVAKRLGISTRRPGESDADYTRRMNIFKKVVAKPGAAVSVEG